MHHKQSMAQCHTSALTREWNLVTGRGHATTSALLTHDVQAIDGWDAVKFYDRSAKKDNSSSLRIVV